MKTISLFKLLAISLLICPLFSSAMEKEVPTIKKRASDFEIYQLLSFATNNNPEFYLPADIVSTIAFTACEITKKRNTAITDTINALILTRKDLKDLKEFSQNNQILTAEQHARHHAIIEKHENITESALEKIANLIQEDPNLTTEIYASMKEYIEQEKKHNEQENFTDETNCRCSIQ